MIPRARIVRAATASVPSPVAIDANAATTPGRARVVPRSVVEASEHARGLVAAAEARAATILAETERRSADYKLRVEEQARADAAAAFAARMLRLAALESSGAERELERAMGIARVLAERLLGAELRLDPSRVAELARQALAEAAGARRITVVAHPEDEAILRARLPGLGVDLAAVTLRPDAARPRGGLRLETELGVLDAELAPQLDRLFDKLRTLPTR